MRRILFMFVIALLALGCDASGKPDSGVASSGSGNGGSDGVAGSGGSGGNACPDGTEGCPCFGNKTCNDDLVCLSTLCVDQGGDGGAGGQGGDGGSPPVTEWFSCEDCSSGHLCVMIRAHEPKATGGIAIDCWIDYHPSSSSLTDVPWQVCHIESDADTTQSKKDFGDMPLSTRVELNLGTSISGAPYPSTCDGSPCTIAVSPGTWFCDEWDCDADILNCHGQDELGRLDNHVMSGNFAFDETGKNLIAVVEP